MAPVGFATPVLYAIAEPTGSLYGTCFTDVNDGSGNPTNSAGPAWFGNDPDSPPPANGFPAVTGYDLATGLGSPTCTLITQLASATPTVPVPPPPPPSSGASFAGIGPNDTCGMISGAVECWGTNIAGQDGNGTAHPSPGCVTNLTGVVPAVQVVEGSSHSCVLFSDGGVWCWGDNTAGQLGNPTPSSSPTPIVAQSLDAIDMGRPPTQIAAGGNTTCALLSDSTVWCWGSNNQGQLGTGSANAGANLPTLVQSLPPASQVAVSSGGAFVCALLVSGGVDCWGTGYLGNLTLDTNSVPVSTPLTNATSIAVGSSHACAIVAQSAGTPSNKLFCWGDNSESEIGEGDVNTGAFPMQEKTPVVATQVSGCASGCPSPINVTAIALGNKFTCVVIAGGSVKCWGDDTFGQLGNGTQSATPNPNPVAVTGLAGVTQLAAGPGRACALAAGISCWGGAPSATARPAPRPLRRMLRSQGAHDGKDGAVRYGNCGRCRKLLGLQRDLCAEQRRRLAVERCRFAGRRRRPGLRGRLGVTPAELRGRGPRDERLRFVRGELLREPERDRRRIRSDVFERGRRAGRRGRSGDREHAPSGQVRSDRRALSSIRPSLERWCGLDAALRLRQARGLERRQRVERHGRGLRAGLESFGRQQYRPHRRPPFLRLVRDVDLLGGRRRTASHQLPELVGSVCLLHLGWCVPPERGGMGIRRRGRKPAAGIPLGLDGSGNRQSLRDSTRATTRVCPDAAPTSSTSRRSELRPTEAVFGVRWTWRATWKSGTWITTSFLTSPDRARTVRILRQRPAGQSVAAIFSRPEIRCSRRIVTRPCRQLGAVTTEFAALEARSETARASVLRLHGVGENLIFMKPGESCAARPRCCAARPVRDVIARFILGVRDGKRCRGALLARVPERHDAAQRPASSCGCAKAAARESDCDGSRGALHRP